MPDGIMYNNNSIVFNSVEEIDGILKIQGIFDRSDSDVWNFIAYEGTKYLNNEIVEITVVRKNKEQFYRGRFDGGTIDQRKNDIRINIEFIIEN